eukprot:GHUV01035477.1.p1 GENE.GHUV01035477.1~~GHUV01035477.1.p1  ORF type:complete len:110 (-),score=23.59 GHUV01035477.1:880-1209(-)
MCLAHISLLPACISPSKSKQHPALLLELSQVKFFDPIIQQDRDVRAGRMECTMQNLADSLTTRSTRALTGAAGGQQAAHQLTEQLDTFMVYNMRRKVSSLLHVRCVLDC